MEIRPYLGNPQYTMSQKGATIPVPVTSSNADRLSKFFHSVVNFFNKVVIKYPATPYHVATLPCEI